MYIYIAVSTKVVPQKCKSVHATRPFGIMGSKSLVLLDVVHCDSASRNEKERIRVCAVSFHHAETPSRSLKQPPLPIMTFDIVA